ncbi:hypothetical protein CDAR_100731 [Caerostris darwini]|uniref:Uncharacterized protein n=1 Tax=Caerostris darwini TaxID=1538125 RepID=A0AAV4VWA6_9ARAC|nr:hypothetical protein CDAR_100731 [Caerostris darwini]
MARPLDLTRSLSLLPKIKAWQGHHLLESRQYLHKQYVILSSHRQAVASDHFLDLVCNGDFALVFYVQHHRWPEIFYPVAKWDSMAGRINCSPALGA